MPRVPVEPWLYYYRHLFWIVMLHFPPWIGGFSALWCFCMWCFPHHCTSNFMGKIQSLLHLVLATDWLPRIYADCIYFGCKSGPISRGRMCKGHWGCLSVLISCIFVLQKHGGRLVHSISLVSFPESECLLQHDVPPKSGFSFSIPMDRSSIGTFHFRNSWASVCSFHADFHECHPRCSWAGSQAAFVIMGKYGASQCVTGQEMLLPLTVIHTFILKVAFNPRCTGLLCGSRCFSPLATHSTLMLLATPLSDT